jgi:hypothetical protein
MILGAAQLIHGIEVIDLILNVLSQVCFVGHALIVC